jgi:glycosyltransferase involved in cell wall biosynthesis
VDGSPRRTVLLHHWRARETDGIRRYTFAVADALRGLGVPTRAVAAPKAEVRLLGRPVGGLASMHLAQYLPPLHRGILHETSFHFATALRRPDVVTFHDVMPLDRPDLYPYGPHLQRLQQRQARLGLRGRHFVAVSHHTKRRMLALWPDLEPERITVIHNGVDASRFHGPPVAGHSLDLPPPSERLRVLLWMNWETRKRADLLLAAAAADAGVEVVHVGSRHVNPVHRPLWERCQPLIDGLQRQGRYSFHAALGDAQLGQVLRSVDALVHLSEDEGFGLPPLEALACGTPVVASDIPPHREVLGDAASFTPLEADAVAAALWRLRQDKDNGRLTRGAEARKAHAARFTWANCARSLVQVYDGL